MLNGAACRVHSGMPAAEERNTFNHHSYQSVNANLYRVTMHCCTVPYIWHCQPDFNSPLDQPI